MLVEDLSFVFTIVHTKDGVPVNSDLNKQVHMSEELKNLDISPEMPLNILYNKLNSDNAIGDSTIDRQDDNATISARERFIVNNFSNDFSRLTTMGKGEEFLITFLARSAYDPKRILTDSVGTNVVISFLVQEDDSGEINEYICNVVFYNEDIIYRVRRHSTVTKITDQAAVVWAIFDQFKNNEEIDQRYVKALGKLRTRVVNLSEKIVANIQLY